MNTFVIDDDIKAQSALASALRESSVNLKIMCFTSCIDAMQKMTECAPDLVLMECVLGGSSSLSFASEILKAYPGCKIIFCTNYPYFAVDAYQIHASGYLMKPINKERLLSEINYFFASAEVNTVYVKCFGRFEVSVGGELLKFKRGKTKEVLAVLVDHNGEPLSGKQICTYIWGCDDSKYLNYLYQLFDDLRQTLRAVNAQHILIKSGNKYALNPDKVSCDYYSFLKIGVPKFEGEYMVQYHWAEKTENYLRSLSKII